MVMLKLNHKLSYNSKMLRFLLSIPTILELIETAMPTHWQGSLRLCKADMLLLFIILFPPFTAHYGSKATFVAVLVDDVVHCRMYTCGGYPPTLVPLYDVRLV